MSNLPRILVAARTLEVDPIHPDGLGACVTYLEALQQAGGAPFIVPSLTGLAVLEELYAMADGVLLPGGEDVEPSRYGEAPHPKLGKTDVARDENEIWLTKRAWADKKPLLGICRGIQVMNVALGGSLFQDIPSQCPSDIRHGKFQDGDWTRRAHNLSLDPSSRLAAIVGNAPIAANSIHHQAINRLAEGLRITSRAEDGIVESVEASDERFCIAVQCHPEALFTEAETRWAKLFEAFVDASRQFRK